LGSISNQEKQSKMLKEIRKHFPPKSWRSESSFATLIHTILSQNTNDRNSDRAMRELRGHYVISPSSLANAKVADLIRLIRPAGLYRSKATHIIQVSDIIQKEYAGKLTKILRLSYRSAKQKLTSLPGVGPKTADILLAFIAGHQIVPVDTHVSRIAKRLGIVPKNAGYETIRLSLESLTIPSQRRTLHLSMIKFGRTTCKARKPLCEKCPINSGCPSSSVHVNAVNNSF
jgi:endonuclease-3